MGCFWVGGIWVTANEWTACLITSELKTVLWGVGGGVGVVGRFYSFIQGLEQPEDGETQKHRKKERELQSCDSLSRFTSSLVSRLDTVL